MFFVDIGPNWEAQIAAVRDANTDDTNLIRFDNTFYRVCRMGAGTVDVMLRARPGSASPGVALTIQASDLYVTQIGGRAFGRYASTVDRMRPQALGIESAAQSLGRSQGSELFEMQSLVVLCLAESLRSDHVATIVGQTIRATTTGLLGAPTRLPIAEMLLIAHAWGQTSDAVFRALSPDARSAMAQSRLSNSAIPPSGGERVDLAKIDPALREFAKKVKVLKRPVPT